MNKLRLKRIWTTPAFLVLLTGCGLTAEDWQSINEGLIAASQQQEIAYNNVYQPVIGSYYPTPPVYNNSNSYYPSYSVSETTSSIDYYIPSNSTYRSYESEINSCKYSCDQVHDSCFNAANTVENHADGVADDRIYYCRAELHSCEQRCAY
jgi:hypothetical protein